MKHSPYSLHLEHLATDAGLLVLHTEDRMILATKRLRHLGTVARDPSDGEYYLSYAQSSGYKNANLLTRLSMRARYRATIANNHTPS